MYRSQGIALLQVLLITAIITILALYFSATAREQVKMAQLATERAEAIIAIETAQNRIFMALLSELRKTNNEVSNHILANWNFYNQPFLTKNNVSVQIQDQSGLIGIIFPDPSLIANIFQENGVDSKLAPVLTDSLLDWQDADKLTRLNGAELGSYTQGPRNGSITLVNETKMVRGMTAELWQQFGDIFTLYQRGPFNPMTAPMSVLAGIIGQNRAAEYVSRRNEIAISPQQFSALTGIQENMEQILYPGDVLEIKLSARRGEALITKTMMVELKPYANANELPVDYLEVRW
ncbi:type II secretion system protein GspK [Alteromonadaceae bacterium BrNp21-10]|nr:type II secretion system protein GspK [Alteromonadaceae bacterium BrNp21-10]